jgi:flagellar biosynthesis protein FlhF
MQVKRYEASSMKDILAKIKRELGPDAIVLSTQQIPGEKNRIEVLAAVDHRFNKEDFADFSGKENDGDIANKEMSFLRKEILEIKMLLRKLGDGGIETALYGIREDMEAMMDLSGVRVYAKDSNVKAMLYSRLVGSGLSKRSAIGLLSDVEGMDILRESSGFEYGLKTVRERMKKKFTEKSKDDRRIKVFLGPTGVGKTTTLAKLAARYAFQQKKSVGLITADTYRIGAVDQLKTYAQIIDLPLEIADSQEAFSRSLERFRLKDYVLVDTPGLGGDAAGHLSSLRTMIAAEEEIEANLLLSLTTSEENMVDAADRFNDFGCDRIIFTKLDECRRFGALYEVAQRVGKPVSYLTTGQNVPQDIERANPDRLVELILGLN